MSISLTVLREQERTRFERLRRDDSRTTIPPDAARSLEAELRRTTDAEVRFDAGSRALYSTDGSNYRQVPIGVVVPRSIDDVAATVAAARKHGAPVLSRGGGTNLAVPHAVPGRGGGAGGYCRKLIAPPAATYSYSVGAGGNGAAVNGNNFGGGAGGSGIIIITAHFGG